MSATASGLATNVNIDSACTIVPDTAGKATRGQGEAVELFFIVDLCLADRR